MSKDQIDFQGALQLVELIKSSANFSEIRLRVGDIEIELRRNGGAALAASAAEPAVPAPSAGPRGSERLAAAATRDGSTGARPTDTPRAPQPAAAAAAAERADAPGVAVIRSPMVGTVYHAPEPGAAPFVTLGQTVAPDDPICIVEVMKLMNSIAAGCHGIVTEILTSDGQAVAHGQALFVISTR